MTVRSARVIGAALAFALLGAGCVARDATEAEKSAAVARQAPVDIDGVPLRDWLQRRTALLVCGALPTAVEHDGERWQVTTPLAERGVGLACAVPIGTDGCFLTSAHNLRLRPVCVCVLTNQGPRWAEATVVAVGDAGVEGDDLAVVRADLPIAGGFELSDAPPRRGTVVYAAGQGVSA
ncbi:MAG: hypothetical protein H0W72_15260, partial [Planctomycetes bacterium]|nr:hypothetical protein [Planctomycetota bacterium]